MVFMLELRRWIWQEEQEEEEAAVVMIIDSDDERKADGIVEESSKDGASDAAESSRNDESLKSLEADAALVKARSVALVCNIPVYGGSILSQELVPHRTPRFPLT